MLVPMIQAHNPAFPLPKPTAYRTPAAGRMIGPAHAVDHGWCARIAYQGVTGAFGELACRRAVPTARAIGFPTIAEAVAAVHRNEVDAVVLPCENLIAGRVPDIHLLLPESALFIVGEHFERIELHLLARPGVRLADIRRVYSHPVALQQVRRYLARHGLQGIGMSNTAMAAAFVASDAGPDEAAVASRQAAESYDLGIVSENIEDDHCNITRFYILASRPRRIGRKSTRLLTTMLFEVPNMPSALFGAISGFAANEINLTRLESYLAGGSFVATRFLCEFEGDPHSRPVRRAVTHLRKNTTSCRILGAYPVNDDGPRPMAALGKPDNSRRTSERGT